MENNYSPTLTKIINYSSEEAGRLRCSSISPAHLLLGLMREEDCTATAILKQMGVDLSTLKQQVESIARGKDNSFIPLLNDDSNRVLRLMFLEARAMKAERAESEHLLLALLRSTEEPATKMLNGMDVDYQSVKSALTQKQDIPQAGFGFTDEDEDDEEEDNDLHNTDRPSQQAAAGIGHLRHRPDTGCC